MNENNYEEYKKNLSRDRKKHKALHSGKILLLLGTAFLLYTLWILPFHADNAHEIYGNEMKAGRTYYPVKVYYIENLQLLRGKTDADDDHIYCIAKFLDRDRNDWIISFTPGKDQELAEHIRISGRFENKPVLTVSGYFRLEYLDELPFEADSFYTVYGSSYADADGRNMLPLNAEYLCEKSDNYTLQALLRPGIPLGSFAAGLLSVLFGGISVIRNRTRKEARA